MVLRKNSVIFILSFFLLIIAGNLSAAINGQDEVYQSRLAALKTGLEINYHPSAKPFIEQYLANPEQIKLLVSRSKFYFPLIEKSLKQKGLPTDLKYLAATASLLDLQKKRGWRFIQIGKTLWKERRFIIRQTIF